MFVFCWCQIKDVLSDSRLTWLKVEIGQLLVQLCYLAFAPEPRDTSFLKYADKLIDWLIAHFVKENLHIFSTQFFRAFFTNFDTRFVKKHESLISWLSVCWHIFCRSIFPKWRNLCSFHQKSSLPFLNYEMREVLSAKSLNCFDTRKRSNKRNNGYAQQRQKLDWTQDKVDTQAEIRTGSHILRRAIGFEDAH